MSSSSAAFCVALVLVKFADCSKRMVNFSMRPSMCFSFSTNCMMYFTLSSAPPSTCPAAVCSGNLAMISGNRLYTTLVLRFDNSWKSVLATRAVDSCFEAVNHRARTSNTARGFNMSFKTKCVNTSMAVKRNSIEAEPSEAGAAKVAYNLPVQGSTTLGCLKSKSPTETSKDWRNVRSSINAPIEEAC